MIYRYKMIIEYDGTRFQAGWQFQPHQTSVQGALEDALHKTLHEKIRVYGAGRTDKNVHALGQVAHINALCNYKADRILNGINFYLRDSGCIVRSVEAVDYDFHARFSSKSKLYRYCVCYDHICGVFDTGRCWHIHSMIKLDIEHMIEQAKHLVGPNDFTSLCDSSCINEATLRSIESADIYHSGNKIYFDFRAQSFLHKQIRIMVGTLIDIARGHLHDIREIIAAKDRSRAGQTAPGYGLYLVEISYPITS